MNHTGRTVVRVALDPNRLAVVDMYEAYQQELQSTVAQWPPESEKNIFRNFVDTYGVFERE